MNGSAPNVTALDGLAANLTALQARALSSAPPPPDPGSEPPPLDLEVMAVDRYSPLADPPPPSSAEKNEQR